MKKVFLMFLALSAFTLVSCGNKSSNSENKVEKSEMSEPVGDGPFEIKIDKVGSELNKDNFALDSSRPIIVKKVSEDKNKVKYTAEATFMSFKPYSPLWCIVSMELKLKGDSYENSLGDAEITFDDRQAFKEFIGEGIDGKTIVVKFEGEAKKKNFDAFINNMNHEASYNIHIEEHQ